MTSIRVKLGKSLAGTVPLFSSVTLLAMACSTTVLAHSGHIHNEASQACIAKTKGDKCSYLVANAQRYTGTCQVFNTKSVCVRNKPIEYLQAIPNEEVEFRTSRVSIEPTQTSKANVINSATTLSK
ncbi:conserved exported hypothetical protein [Alteromonas sp. 38]|uniref:hypothetical protein n=1 Tax=Alteromonas TaxID=226 RepID=UPI0012F02BE2|nr:MULTISPECIES: hypothetical protein [Alteromonas]CAD5270298.1 conserved exported hypothetical protein [Alteromonas sp. 154]VXB95630.1 conserved exported hypothetical protein [Alteromonas sp. 38]